MLLLVKVEVLGRLVILRGFWSRSRGRAFGSPLLSFCSLVSPLVLLLRSFGLTAVLTAGCFGGSSALFMTSALSDWVYQQKN